MSRSQMFPVRSQAPHPYEHHQQASACVIRRGLIDDCARSRLLYAWSKYYFMTEGVDASQPCTCPIEECRGCFANAAALVEHLETCKQFDNEKMWCPGCCTWHTYSKVSKDQCCWTLGKPGRTTWERLTKSRPRSKHDPKSTASLRMAGFMEPRLPAHAQAQYRCPHSPESAFSGFSREGSPSYELPDQYGTFELGGNSTQADPRRSYHNKAVDMMDSSQTTNAIPSMSSGNSSRSAYASFDFTEPLRHTHNGSLSVSPASSRSGTLNSFRTSTTTSFPGPQYHETALAAEMAGDDIFHCSGMPLPRSTSPAPMEIDSAQAIPVLAHPPYSHAQREGLRHSRPTQVPHRKIQNENNHFPTSTDPITPQSKAYHSSQSLPTPNSSRQNSGQSIEQMSSAAPRSPSKHSYGHFSDQTQAEVHQPNSSPHQQGQWMTPYTNGMNMYPHVIPPAPPLTDDQHPLQTTDNYSFMGPLLNLSASHVPSLPDTNLAIDPSCLSTPPEVPEQRETQTASPPGPASINHDATIPIQYITIRCNYGGTQCPFKVRFSKGDAIAEIRVKKNLRRHVQRNHEATGQRWQCDKCSESFGRRDNLKKHQRTIHINGSTGASSLPSGGDSRTFQASPIVSHDVIEVAAGTVSPASPDEWFFELPAA